MMNKLEQLIAKNLIVRHYAGSRAYGTALPTSDTDIRGMFVADPINVRTPFFPVYEVNIENEEDSKVYELSQFMRLATLCNPNVIETLWVDESDVLESTPAYALLRAAAPKLLSSKIAFTTSGYAMSQLKRIKGHNKWLMNPQPEEHPQQKDYVSLVHNFTSDKILKFHLANYASDMRLIPFGSQIFGLYSAPGYCTYEPREGTINTDYYEGHTHELEHPLMIVRFNKQQHEDVTTIWKNYWTWKKNRNVVRSALEAEHGYDTKHAMHLVRLLRMGAEALETGIVNVRRTDAEQLLQIRNGAWSYEQVIEYAEHMDAYVKVLYKRTALPKAPDIKLAAQLVLQIQDMMWSTQ